MRVIAPVKPRLATGVGLDWKDVHPLLARRLGDLALPIEVVTTRHANQPLRAEIVHN